MKIPTRFSTNYQNMWYKNQYVPILKNPKMSKCARNFTKNIDDLIINNSMKHILS